MGFMPGTEDSHSPHQRTLPGEGRTAVVTGASSGIGAATATRLAADGFDVVLGARRVDRLEALASSIGARALPLDVTDAASVAAFAGALDRVDVLVNNAGGAFDAAQVADADLDSWARTYDVNVLGTVRLTKALLPALRASGSGDVVFVSSTAALTSYEGGASYTAAKHGVHTLAETLRLELNGEPVRVVEIAPGMVRTEEFSLNRLGATDKADAVYRGVREPLVAEDIADCIAWTVTRPHHVNIDLMVVRPLAQAAQHKVAREN
jgi:NADP-dependent 3-hydroxy acid dehydrogenase YdfG